MSSPRRFLPFVLIAVAALSLTDTWAGRLRTVKTITETVMVNGQRRTFRLDVPKAVNAAAPTALVFGFHGKGGSGAKFASQTGWNQMAAAAQFILVCPDAAPEWPLEVGPAAKDLAFFDAVLAFVRSRHAIDPDRIFVTGMSNGASFTHLLASERDGVVAAIAPHSGKLGAYALNGINAATKYPVFVIHGVADTTVPVSRAREARDLYAFEGHEVLYREIPGLGHKWATSSNITPAIWAFFDNHPRGE